jgi:hypothetical protein
MSGQSIILLVEGAAPKADEGMGEHGHGGRTAEGRPQCVAAREGIVSDIAYHGQVDAAERYRGGPLPARLAFCGLVIGCALIVFAPSGAALAVTQSILVLPDDTPQATPAPASPLPLLPNREIPPREIHSPDESTMGTARPVELQERVKPAPKAAGKREPPPATALVVVPAASPQPPAHADKHDDPVQQGQFAEHTPPAAASSGAPAPPVSDLVAALIRRGDEFLQQRDIAAARLLYERAALSGNAHAAMLAGKTYDPLYFAEIGISGIAPDRGKAIEWYGAATALGDAEAASRGEKLRGSSKQ